MRRVFITLAATAVVSIAGASVALADPSCPPVERGYVSLANPEPGGSFGHFQASLAQGGGSDFGHQVSREGRTEVPCP
jgi:hypothetical protein